MKNKRSTRWGVILAGGDGVRLLPLTRAMHGDDRPKQFSRVVGTKTLLHQTRARVHNVLQDRGDRTLIVVTQRHEIYYHDPLADVSQRNVLVQPYNHGTSQAILFSLLRIASEDPEGIVSFFPSDHYFADDSAWARQMETAFRIAEMPAPGKERVVLLGVQPDAPETSYGWIEPDSNDTDPKPVAGKAVPVRRFWEKPTMEQARNLMRRGCLWNSFIMTGPVPGFVRLFEKTLPRLLAEFKTAVAAGFTNESIARVFGREPASNFSTDVLARTPESLLVLPGSAELGWSDLGEPERVTRLAGLQVA